MKHILSDKVSMILIFAILAVSCIVGYMLHISLQPSSVNPPSTNTAYKQAADSVPSPAPTIVATQPDTSLAPSVTKTYTGTSATVDTAPSPTPVVSAPTHVLPSTPIQSSGSTTLTVVCNTTGQVATTVDGKSNCL